MALPRVLHKQKKTKQSEQRIEETTQRRPTIDNKPLTQTKTRKVNKEAKKQHKQHKQTKPYFEGQHASAPRASGSEAAHNSLVCPVDEIDGRDH